VADGRRAVNRRERGVRPRRDLVSRRDPRRAGRPGRPDAGRPDAGRYHRYVSRSCPWARGVALVRRLAGLTDVVSLDVVDPDREDDGWAFTPEKDGCTPDAINGCAYLRNVYLRADPDYPGRVTVPVLWDRAEGTIVNNESIELMDGLAIAFDECRDGIDLSPGGDREAVDRIVDAHNDGVYRAGVAASQAATDETVRDVFDALDRWNRVLAGRRYLAGDRLTFADARIFPTLIRFDAAYHTGFDCDRNYLHEYDHLWPYLRDPYRTPGVAGTVRMDHIGDQGHFRGEITPIAPALDCDAPHDRDRLPGDVPGCPARTVIDDGRGRTVADEGDRPARPDRLITRPSGGSADVRSRPPRRLHRP
jgi:putative glutathione S-transferase